MGDWIFWTRKKLPGKRKPFRENKNKLRKSKNLLRSKIELSLIKLAGGGEYKRKNCQVPTYKGGKNSIWRFRFSLIFLLLGARGIWKTRTAAVVGRRGLSSPVFSHSVLLGVQKRNCSNKLFVSEGRKGAGKKIETGTKEMNFVRFIRKILSNTPNTEKVLVFIRFVYFSPNTFTHFSPDFINLSFYNIFIQVFLFPFHFQIVASNSNKVKTEIHRAAIHTSIFWKHVRFTIVYSSRFPTIPLFIFHFLVGHIMLPSSYKVISSIYKNSQLHEYYTFISNANIISTLQRKKFWTIYSAKSSET